MRYVLHLNFEGATNNIAVYEALLHGLRTVVTLGVKRLVALGDSELVIRQVMKAIACRDHKMEAYCTEVRKFKAKFNELKLRHIPQRDNEEANSLARINLT
jgi:ribonuclease HI